MNSNTMLAIASVSVAIAVIAGVWITNNPWVLLGLLLMIPIVENKK